MLACLTLVFTFFSDFYSRTWRSIECAVTRLIHSDDSLLQFYVVQGYRVDFNHMRLKNRGVAQVYHIMCLTGNMCLITMCA